MASIRKLPHFPVIFFAFRAGRRDEPGVNRTYRILALARGYGPERLEAACWRGTSIGATSYRSIASILQNGLDKAFLSETAPDPTPNPPRQHPRPGLLQLSLTTRETRMLANHSHERLLALRLTGMAKAFDDQLRQPDVDALSFEGRLALMIDREVTERENRRLITRLKFACLRQTAVIEDIDLRTARGIDRAFFAKLVDGDWISRKQNLLITGATESDSYCPPRYAIRMPSHFDADRQTTAAECGADPRRA